MKSDCSSERRPLITRTSGQILIPCTDRRRKPLAPRAISVSESYRRKGSDGHGGQLVLIVRKQANRSRSFAKAHASGDIRDLIEADSLRCEGSGKFWAHEFRKFGQYSVYGAGVLRFDSNFRYDQDPIADFARHDQRSARSILDGASSEDAKVAKRSRTHRRCPLRKSVPSTASRARSSAAATFLKSCRAARTSLVSSDFRRRSLGSAGRGHRRILDPSTTRSVDESSMGGVASASPRVRRPRGDASNCIQFPGCITAVR